MYLAVIQGSISAGQWLRNPRVLRLDEATSNLGSEIENSVQAVFEKTGKERTIVIIAHRLATVQNADDIFVSGDGRVVEPRNQATLLRQRGLYLQMVSYFSIELRISKLTENL